ncbi:MAG: Uncharacterized protein Greene041679_685 [Parcubacteria group bacterium Greene0416_79]|nr:MAG: Uncharacterized protein Greene041679_685 [Parcubacteria group bacterium Greene0416_79]
MGKRGPKPKGKVRIKWSSNFAYAIGLIASDGNLSPTGRHITFVSKEIEQINNFLKCLKISTKIGKTFSGYSGMWAYRVQFGDVLFYKYLQSVGLSPAKSKTIGRLKIPDEYFFDFLRGVFDGDGSTYSYWDKRWKSSFMFYLCFASASKVFTDWLRIKIKEFVGSTGHITKDGKGLTYQLKYAKGESFQVLKKMYYSKRCTFLSRKYLKVKKTLAIVGKSLP